MRVVEVVTTLPVSALARANIKLVLPPPPIMATSSPEDLSAKASGSDQPAPSSSGRLYFEKKGNSGFSLNLLPLLFRRARLANSG